MLLLLHDHDEKEEEKFLVRHRGKGDQRKKQNDFVSRREYEQWLQETKKTLSNRDVNDSQEPNQDEKGRAEEDEGNS